MAERQRVRIMPAPRAHALKNACASLVMRELCGFSQHLVQPESIGIVSHGSILMDTPTAAALQIWYRSERKSSGSTELEDRSTAKARRVLRSRIARTMKAASRPTPWIIVDETEC